MESPTRSQLDIERKHSDTPTRGKSFDDFEDYERERHRDSSRYKSRDAKRRHRSEKDKEYKDRDGSLDRESREKDLEKDRGSRNDRKREDRVDSHKSRYGDKREGYEYEIDKEVDNVRERSRRDHRRERDAEMDGGYRDYERQREAGRDRVREKERERKKDRHKDHKKGRDEGDADRDRRKEKNRDRERDDGSLDGEKERSRHRSSRITHDVDDERKETFRNEDFKDFTPPRKGYHRDENEGKASEDKDNNEDITPSPTKLEERIQKMKEDRLRNKSSSDSDVLAWVNKSRKLEERTHEKEKAFQLSKVFEEQDKATQDEFDDGSVSLHNVENLAGVKVTHGLEKVAEGGAVVLTLKDQNILTGDGINEELDMLENVEIGEQKQRDEAYRAAKKTTGVYEDKFGNGMGSEKTILPQYDVPPANEGIALDERGQFSGEAAKKLEELQRRLQGASTSSHFEDLNSFGKSSTDYYTQEEMLQFRKPKKRKSLRKREKIDIDALEAEAVSAGLGGGDLGSRNSERLNNEEEKERLEAEKRNIAFQSAYNKADEASKALRMEQTLTVYKDEDEKLVFGDDDEELYKSVERARKIALKKQDEEASSGPRALALLASASANKQTEDGESSTARENRVVFTEMEEFVWGLQLDEEAKKPEGEDVSMEDLPPPPSIENPSAPTSLTDAEMQNSEDVPVLDETIEEPAVGKGLSGALKLLKERGTLKETVDWGGRNMDKKKSKLVGINDAEGAKEIRIERTDEFGRILTPKESFRLLSHRFHGKGPGKMKQEKKMKQYQEELKLKKMKNSDTPSLSVERMKEAQARLKTPYLVLSGHVKPGQTSDPASGFATVEKEFPGGLTPMLGDRKVEHFLGIKRKAEAGDM